jgi:hypothetical protein
VVIARASSLAAWLACALCIAIAAPSHAQAPIQASVDRPVVRDNESFTLVLRAEGPVRGEPEDAALAAQFDVLNRSSSRRVGIVNGRTSEVSEWQYQLMPKAAGEFTIPSLRVGDRQSNAVPVRVLAPEPSSGSAAADIFMELDAEPKTLYAQSQVLFTLRLFIGVSTGRATLTAPETSGVEAIVEKLGEDAQYQASRGGRNFVVRERRYAVFPQSAGALTIGPVTFEAMVIPDRGFSRVQRFRSDVLALEVLPAVAPPQELAGAAWLPAQSVTLTEQWSDGGDELTVGIPSTRTIVVEGVGLLETQLPDISVPTQTGVRQYADQPELEREITSAGMLSRRRVSYAVIAQTEGEVTLPGVRLPWWNVVDQRWEVAELAERTVRVAPSGERVTAEAPAAPAPTAVPPTLAEERARSFWPLASALLALGWLVTMALWWRSRSGARPQTAPRAGAPAAVAAPRPTSRKILRDLESACVVGDPVAARGALLAFAETRFTESPPRSLGALAALLPENAGREVLALEAHIYGAGGGGTWRGEALRATLAELEKAGETPDAGPVDPLAPLYR